MGKTIKVAEAVAAIPDGATLMIGGFMAVGTPRRLIDELVRQNRKDLTVIANNTARPGIGIGKLISARLVRRVITSHIGTNPDTQRQMLAGELQVELVPQGTLVERIRAAGYGLGGVLTSTGIGTMVEEGKRTLEVDGRTFLLELPLRADYTLINARRANHIGQMLPDEVETHRAVSRWERVFHRAVRPSKRWPAPWRTLHPCKRDERRAAVRFRK